MPLHAMLAILPQDFEVDLTGKLILSISGDSLAFSLFLFLSRKIEEDEIESGQMK